MAMITAVVLDRGLLGIEQDPSEVPKHLAELITGPGETRYEARHGIGTAVGYRAAVADRATPAEVGSRVEVLAIAGRTRTARGDLFFVRTRQIASRAEMQATAASAAAALAAREAAKKEIRAAIGRGRDLPALADRIAELYPPELYPQGARWGRCRVAPLVAALRSGGVDEEEAKAIAILLGPTSGKPTMALRMVRREIA